MNYQKFLEGKAQSDAPTGLVKAPPLDKSLFAFQKDITGWALRRGRAAIFADCGLGKTFMQLEWARHVPGDVLILAPLAVAAQTVKEGARFGIPVNRCFSQKDFKPGINITNYDRLDHFDATKYTGVVLDESSILKAYDGKTRTQIIEAFSRTPFRLAATATPSPNDYMELGNHAEFLGVMTRAEMLAMFFTHDGGETQKWRLKGHAQGDFWRWVCSWAVMLRKPSDLGYDDGDFKLPPLRMQEHIVRASTPTDGMLFAMPAASLQERISARRDTIYDRIYEAERLVRLSWIENKNENITGYTGKRIGQESSLNGKDGITRIAKENASVAANTDLPTENKKLSPNGDILPPIEKNGSHICVNDTNGKNQLSSPTIGNGGKRTETNTGIPITNSSTELTSTNIIASSRLKMGNVRSAGTKKRNSPLITATTENKSGGFSVAGATPVSETSVTTRDGCVVQPTISKTQWVVWCNLNKEQDELAKLFGPLAVSIQGNTQPDKKESLHSDWIEGRVPVLITKPDCFGFGMNWQHCSNVIFVGLNDSFEMFYQAVRRTWRFGQKQSVNVHMIGADTEGAVMQNIKRKEADAARMAEEMVKNMKDFNSEALHQGTKRQKAIYKIAVEKGDKWEMRLGDCVDEVAKLKADSLHYSIYSPPFASLYTYSNSDRDMGNCTDTEQFLAHYAFLVKELYCVTMPGRLTSFHCMDLPTSKVRDGIIGLRDFRGELVRIHQEAGWVLHSQVVIWKDPVTAMQRTKAIGLLYKQLKKDSHLSRQGIPDYLVTMRKPGENPEPITHTPEDFPVGLWQKYASPVWMDINPNETLQYRTARENNDERHICPLQLEVVRRALKLWSNPGDLVLSPFAGIGSEGHEALMGNRRFLGIELKESYWKCAVNNLKTAESALKEGLLI